MLELKLHQIPIRAAVDGLGNGGGGLRLSIITHTELCLGNTYIGFWTSHSENFVAYNMKHCLIEGPIIPIYFQSQPEQVIFESLCWGPSKNHIICNTKISLCSHLEIQIKLSKSGTHTCIHFCTHYQNQMRLGDTFTVSNHEQFDLLDYATSILIGSK